jgi:carboxyl-terminal processing protease
MTKKFIIVAILFIAFGAIIGGLFGRLPGRTSASGDVTPAKISSDYEEALNVVNANYVSSVDGEKTMDSAIQGMLLTLDPHSSFFTRAEFRKLYEDQSSRFYGIGVSILQHRDGVYVQSVVAGTPAEKAGLKYGDRFVTVDGQDSTKWTSSEVSNKVRGDLGTTVNLKVERVGANAPLDFNIVRGEVPYPSIRNHFMLKDDVGYVGFTGAFQETSAAELDESIADLKKQGMKQMILDLRGNPGGLLPQAVEVVSRFIEPGQTVVSVKGRSRYAMSQELKTVSGKTETMPLVVLINGGSASASEIVSGAIQDYGRGVIVGTDSFGKGLVQRVFQLPSGTGLALTTARYYTPYGRSLQRDYSSGVYNYITHHLTPEDDDASTEPKPQGSPVTTANGRVLYGGQGITPDVESKPQNFTNLRYRINEAAFFFTRQLVSGKIGGLESYKVDRQKNNQTLGNGEFQVNDQLLEAFRKFATEDKASNLTAESINSQLDYAKTRIREEIATANYSSEAGSQVLLESDQQLLKALEVMPDARKMLETFLKNNNVG